MDFRLVSASLQVSRKWVKREKRKHSTQYARARGKQRSSNVTVTFSSFIKSLFLRKEIAPSGHGLRRLL